MRENPTPNDNPDEQFFLGRAVLVDPKTHAESASNEALGTEM